MSYCGVNFCSVVDQINVTDEGVVEEHVIIESLIADKPSQREIQILTFILLAFALIATFVVIVTVDSLTKFVLFVLTEVKDKDIDG